MCRLLDVPSLAAADALDDERPFEFHDCADDVDDGTAQAVRKSIVSDTASARCFAS